MKEGTIFLLIGLMCITVIFSAMVYGYISNESDKCDKIESYGFVTEKTTWNCYVIMEDGTKVPDEEVDISNFLEPMIR